MKLSWRTEAPHLLLLAGMFALAFVSWPDVSDRIPVHWGVGGEPDGFGGRFEGLLILPITALLFYVVLLFLPRIDPRRENYDAFAGPYAFLRLALVAFLALLHGAAVLAIRGEPINMTAVALVLMGLLFLALGAVLGRLRPNWFIGIRTPWTLSSDTAWTSTHRLGGRVFMGSGVLFVVAGFIGRPWAFWVSMATLVIAALGLGVYSWFAWKMAADRTRTSR